MNLLHKKSTTAEQKPQRTRRANYGWMVLATGFVAAAVIIGFSLIHSTHLSTPAAQAQSLGATNAVSFGMSIYGSELTVQGVPAGQDTIGNAEPDNGVTWSSSPISTNPSYGYGSIGHKVYINSSSYGVDFRVGMKICMTDGTSCHVGWTPWAYDVANNPSAINYSPIVGPGPYAGGVVCGDPTATLHNRLGLTYIAVQTRPLPASAVLNNVSLTLYPIEYDYNVPVDSPIQSGSNCSLWQTVSGDAPGVTPNGGGWSNGAFDKWNNASTDGFVVQMSAGASVFDAVPVGNNLPTQFNAGETKAIGTDGQPLEVTMKNTGTVSWPAEQGSATGTPTGQCDVSINGSSVLNAPAATAANYGKSCTVNYIYTGTTDILNHSGSFSASPEQVKYTKIVPVTVTYAAPQQTCFPEVSSPCLLQQANNTNSNTGPAFISKAYAIQTGIPACIGGNGGSQKVCETDPSGYETSVGGTTNILPGDTATFMLNSLTATTTPGVYTEVWQMENGTIPFGSALSIPITVGTGAGASGTLNVSSTNIVTGGSVVGSWTATGPTNEASQNAISATYSGLPLPGGVANYDIIPTDAQGFTLGAVKNSVIAQATKVDIFTRAFTAVHNAFTSVAFANSNLVSAEVCVPSAYVPDPSTGIFTCAGGPVPSVTLTASTSIANSIIMWYPLASMDVTPTSSLPLDGSGNGIITVQNSGTPGSELDWTASTTDTWFSLSSGGGPIVNDSSEQGSSGATQGLTITTDPSKLAAGNYSGVVHITGTSKYCSADPSAGRCVFPASISVSFTGGTCSGSGCPIICTPPSCNPINTSPTVSISPASKTITLGQSQQLVISSANANACTGSGDWAAMEPCTGTVTVTPGTVGSFTYKIKATNSFGSANATAIVTVEKAPVSPSHPPSCSLGANPTSVLIPGSSQLTYSCVNVNSCTLSGGGFGASSSVTVNGTTAKGTTTDAPMANTFYTISCYGTGSYSGTTSSASVEVTVTNPGRIETSTF